MENETLKNAGRHFSKLGLMFFLGSLIIYAVQFVIPLIILRLVPSLWQSSDALLIVSMLPVYVIAIPILILLVRRVPSVQIIRHNMTAGQFACCFCMAYAIMYVGNIIGQLITLGIGAVKGSSVSNILEDVISDLSPWTAFFIMVLLAPVIEEFVFRKLIVDRLVRYGEGTAVLMSGLMFGLFHGNLNQFAYAFLLGAFLGFIYVKTGKLIYTVVLHMILNFMGSVITMLLVQMPLFQNGFDSTELILSGNIGSLLIYMLYAFLIFVLVIVGIALLIINRKKFTLRPGDLSLPKGQRFRAYIVNVGMILYILFWVGQILLQLLE